MNKIVYDETAMKFMVLFETMTKTNLKDCIINDEIIFFIVEENQIAKAIGKQGSNIRNLQKALKRRIKIVEYSNDLIKFINNFIYPIKAKEVINEDGVIKIMTPDIESRGILIGKSATNLRSFESIVKRYFQITEIKIY